MTLEPIAVYHIYPLAFYDTKGAGHGDVVGIIKKLDYLKWLGITHIWIGPLYQSRWQDHGYDVVNYRTIDPRFGTMAEFEKLIKAATKRGLKIVMDMIMNHTSDHHEWFVKAKKGISPYRDYYIWRPTPNQNQQAQFANLAWSYVPELNQYYYHHFSRFQPDLNWDSDQVQAEFAAIINFWIAKGVAGFRFDVVDMVGKDVLNNKIINPDRAFSRLQKLQNHSWGKQQLFTVGECWSTSYDNAIKYVNKDNGVFTTIFNGGHLFTGWDPSRWLAQPFDLDKRHQMLDRILTMQHCYYGHVRPAIFVENHDTPRIVSRFFEGENDYQQKAKVIAVAFYGMPGIPVLYQGQVAGMPNCIFDNLASFEDPETIKFIANHKADKDVLAKAAFGSRDNGRGMMYWNDDVIKPQNWNYQLRIDPRALPIETQQNQPQSSLHLYRFLLKLRAQHHQLFTDGQVKIDHHPSRDIFSYTVTWGTQQIWFIVNWGTNEQQINITNWVVLKSEHVKDDKIGQYGFLIGIKQ